MTTRQLTLLLAIRAGVSFHILSAAIAALQAKGLITNDLQLTEAGQQATAGYLLSRSPEGRVTGVWQIDRVLTTRYSSPLGERESLGCTAEEYEAMCE